METSDVIQIILTIIALLVAIRIPYRIAWEQQYSSLLEEYRSLDFAIALQGVIQFFTKDCAGDMDRVKAEYKKRFIKEIENNPGKIDKENCLHFQRRLLAQFFWQLNQCAKPGRIGRKRIIGDFTKSEAKLIKILIHMGQAIEEDPVLYKDLSSSALVKKPSHLRGQNKGLSELYQILRNSKRYMTN